MTASDVVCLVQHLGETDAKMYEKLEGKTVLNKRITKIGKK